MAAKKPSLSVRPRPSDAPQGDADDYVARAGASDSPPARPIRPSELGGRQVLRRTGDDIRRMTIRVPYELGDAFVQQAADEGRDISKLAAEAFQLYLHKQAAKQQAAKKKRSKK